MYRAIIIDDELNGLKTLKLLIEKYIPIVRVVASSINPEEGIKLIEDYKPDVLFLDISMPKMNGFELLNRLNYKGFKLIFTTAHEEYAIKAIKNKAFDYLLKPIDVDELKHCVNNLSAGIETKTESFKTNNVGIIELSVKDGIIFIKPADIIRLEASGSYTEFYLTNGTKHVASKTLKDYEAFLHPSYFYRCHISHLVNLHHVVKLVSTNGLYAKMSDESAVEVAKKNKQIFIEKLKSC